MKNLIEFITESEQISSATIASAAVKSVAAVRSLLTKNGFECAKIDKYSDKSFAPTFEVKGRKVVSVDYAEFKIFKDGIELGKIKYKKQNLMHFIYRTKDILYSMRFIPSNDVKLKDNYKFYEILSEVFNRKYADEIGCDLFYDFLKNYIN